MAFQLTAEDLGFEQNPSCIESTGTDLSVYCNKKRKSPTTKISFVDLSTEKEFPIVYSTDENVSVVE